MPGKIFTCCYCSTRSFVVSGAGVALSCSNCGAPLKIQKARPLAKEKAVKPAKSGRPPAPVKMKSGKALKKEKKKKRKKSLFNRVVSEAFDVIEDIFD